MNYNCDIHGLVDVHGNPVELVSIDPTQGTFLDGSQDRVWGAALRNYCPACARCGGRDRAPRDPRDDSRGVLISEEASSPPWVQTRAVSSREAKRRRQLRAYRR